ncbi:hypothetical protein D3C86_1771390 [compost metagenome]
MDDGVQAMHPVPVDRGAMVERAVARTAQKPDRIDLELFHQAFEKGRRRGDAAFLPTQVRAPRKAEPFREGRLVETKQVPNGL